MKLIIKKLEIDRKIKGNLGLVKITIKKGFGSELLYNEKYL